VGGEVKGGPDLVYDGRTRADPPQGNAHDGVPVGRKPPGQQLDQHGLSGSWVPE
jgi:hypothetical protein